MKKTPIEIKKYYLFPTELYITNLDIDNSIFIKKLYDLKLNSPGVQKSNKGGWQSEDILENKNFNFLHQVISEIAFKAFNQKITLVGMWGNISSKYHYNAIHHHGRPHHGNLKNNWSGVYYLQTFKNSGDFTIHNQCDTDLNESYNFPPGTLILFPSNLPHSVDPNMEDQDRISIAFNFKLD
jgi:hypothetical protein